MNIEHGISIYEVLFLFLFCIAVPILATKILCLPSTFNIKAYVPSALFSFAVLIVICVVFVAAIGAEAFFPAAFVNYRTQDSAAYIG